MSPIVMLAIVVVGVLAAVAVVAWLRRARAAAAVAAAMTVWPLWSLLRALPLWAQVAIGAGVLAGGLAVLLRRRSSSSTVARWGARARRTAGVATTTQIARRASGTAMRRQATIVRPSMSDMNRRQRARVRTTEVAVPLARVGAQRVWSSIEDVTLVFGGPRTGKSGWLGGRIIDAPGAALITSTRTDLYELTRRLRERRGPVHVFNAVGLAGLPSTVTFDPLTGCQDPVAAAERATDMLAAGATTGGGDRDFWNAQARRVLAALLHAAALGDLTMRDVLAWVAAPDEHNRQITSLLRRSIEPAYVEDAAQFLTTNDRTRSSITSTIMPALGWLTSPAAAAAAAGDGPALDVAALIDGSATIYILGAEETQAAALVCALTGYIAREARRIAASKPGGRLDPPLTLLLDEAALISPVPLDSWTADMGGRGVTIIAAFQSRAQVLARWGDTGAAIILNNAASIMVFGGTRDRGDLEYWSTLAGDRDEPVVTRGKDGRVTSRSVRKTAVLAPSQLANLPAGQVVVFRRGMAPAIGRVQMAWKRRDVRADARVTRRAGAVPARVAQQVGELGETWAVPGDEAPTVAHLRAVPAEEVGDDDRRIG